jgi:eukaryotic-like serine/threonine-protein kinase
VDVLSQLRDALAAQYRVEGELGAGGMATVYLAEDLKHRRRVALKVLRPELAAVLGTERFLAEINVTANLQHPNLLPLFDSGETDGLLYYVMPYVEGESLRARLQRERQLPANEAVRIAVAVASALDHAHRHGVIHRDLKPENILLHEGQPLVTDFGIALAVSNAGGARVTQTGLSLGTPLYMSPEQATGDRVIDARSDIYSLAAVLYEMLVGDPPHVAGTTQAIIAKVLTEKPTSVRVYRETVPEHVDLAVQRAMCKLPADRFATAGEFADALNGARVVGMPATPTATAPPAEDAFVIRIPAHFKRRVRASLPWATALVALLVAGGIAVRAPRTTVVASGWPTLFPITFADTLEVRTPPGVTLTISPDGSQIAFDAAAAGVSGIFVRRLDALDARLVRGTEGGSRPQFSPDGSWLLFAAADGKLKKVPVGGGAPLTVADSASAGSWGDANTIVYAHGNRLYRISADGGAPAVLATVDTTRSHHRYGWPHVLPGGEAALITIWKRSGSLDNAELGVVRLRDGEVTELRVPGTGPRYVSTGHVVFGRADGSLFAAPFSLRTLALTGAAVPVLDGVIVKGGGAVEIAISDNGTLIYKGSTSSAYRGLVRVSPDGREQRLGVDSQAVRAPRVSPDGRRIALAMDLPTDIWTKDMVTGALTRVTMQGNRSRPAWTPDGRRIAYVAMDSGQQSSLIYAQPWDGSGMPELFAKADNGLFEISFGPAGAYFAVRRGANPPDRDILIASYDSPHALQTFLASAGMETAPRVSPNGRVLAYVTDETGRREVYVRPLPGPGGRVQVSINGGDEPVWSPDANTLYYRSPTHLMAAILTDRPELDVLRRETLFADAYMRDQGYPNYDVFPNGTEFVFVKTDVPDLPTLMGIAHWTTELRRRTQGGTPPR